MPLLRWNRSETGLENVLAVFISSALDLHGGCKTLLMAVNWRCASVPFSRHQDLCVGCLLPGIFQINSRFQRKVPVVLSLCKAIRLYSSVRGTIHPSILIHSLNGVLFNRPILLLYLNVLMQTALPPRLANNYGSSRIPKKPREQKEEISLKMFASPAKRDITGIRLFPHLLFESRPNSSPRGVSNLNGEVPQQCSFFTGHSL